jgi:hypothetical protein
MEGLVKQLLADQERDGVTQTQDTGCDGEVDPPLLEVATELEGFGTEGDTHANAQQGHDEQEEAECAHEMLQGLTLYRVSIGMGNREEMRDWGELNH